MNSDNDNSSRTIRFHIAIDAILCRSDVDAIYCKWCRYATQCSKPEESEEIDDDFVLVEDGADSEEK